ncbi:MAG TPA: right-handed parallel beta-helix repeat-containing protein [bacterium]|jgi:hypothetical protein
MRKDILATIFTILFASQSNAAVLYIQGLGPGAKGSGSEFGPDGDLQTAIDRAHDGDTLIIMPGIYSANAQTFSEELCGNCQEHKTPVTASRGFLIEGKALTIVGSGAKETTLITNAGYGVLFLNSRDSRIENLSITGGKRDADGNATDAGIVAKYSRVTIRGVQVRDNTDRDTTVVVGIGGIFGREDCELFIIENEIANNGWDGIALYRGATAYIADNVIRDGRGAGIGITWDAAATVLRNRISGYWKGIGTFGASRAVVCNNLVQNCLGWGIIATGESYLDCVNNNVIHNGNCGLAIWSDECHGRFINNIVIYNGWKDQWVAPQVGFWKNGKLENFVIANNDVWGNVKGNWGDMDDLTGINGNISSDPMFVSDQDFHLQAGSPCINAGSPLISEEDGTVSDMGMQRTR